ncbi:MAG: hypothetical protein AB1416_07050, partial [Actinomycetota bacterium]
MAGTGNSDAAWALVDEWMGTLRDLAGVSQLAVGWDQETLMPASAAPGRAHLAGTLAALEHRELVRPDVGDALAALAEVEHDDPDRRAIVRWALRDRARAAAVPEDLARA